MRISLSSRKQSCRWILPSTINGFTMPIYAKKLRPISVLHRSKQWQCIMPEERYSSKMSAWSVDYAARRTR
eukprot:5776003-Ditylum_brightwellii.AAC.1